MRPAAALIAPGRSAKGWSRPLPVLLTAVFALVTPVAPAAAVAPGSGASTAQAGGGGRYRLVEEFTAATLEPGEVKIGTDLDYGVASDGRWMVGTDLVATALGVPSATVKWLAYNNGEHEVAIGVRGAYLNKNTLFWQALGNIKDHYATLDARVVRPSVSWTNTLSPRLRLHTFWAKGLGKVSASLTEKGRRALWSTKHPGADYDSRDPSTQAPTSSSTTATSQNQAKASASQDSPTRETIQVQSIAGLAQERFQLTGEFKRASGNKVLITSRIEETRIEKLRAEFFRLTLAHQWIWPAFQMRLGVGAQYYVMSGQDLDGETADQAGWQPASDVAFYWRF